METAPQLRNAKKKFNAIDTRIIFFFLVYHHKMAINHKPISVD